MKATDRCPFGGGGVVDRFRHHEQSTARFRNLVSPDGVIKTGRNPSADVHYLHGRFTTFGTMGLSHVGFRAAKPATEEDEPDPLSPGIARARTEENVEALASLGVRATMIRLAPSVHGDGDTGLVPQLIGIARKNGRFACVGDGQNRWPAVHRRDAARLFRLALEKGVAGARYHGVADEGIPFRSIAEIIGRQLGIPVESISVKDAGKSFSWFGDFAATDNPASSVLTRNQLGWEPTHPGLLANLNGPAYFAGK